MRRPSRKEVKKFLLSTTGIAGVFALGVVLWIGILYISLPSPDLLENRIIAESTKIYDRTGEVLLYEIHGEERRTIIPSARIPEHIKQATIAIEDAGFYEHGAIDVSSIIRAFFVNIKEGRFAQGGSTITQQLAKKAFLSDDKIITRKIKELFLAIRLEKRFTKDQILASYLNQIPYGSNAYGIQAASQTFFEKDVENLTLAEIALLVSLPQAPSYYSPWGSHIDDLTERKNTVLDRMAQLGFITQEEARDAQVEVLAFKKPSLGIKAPHFVITVQEYLNKTYGEDFVRVNGLKVITTLDWDLQQTAERVIEEGVKRNEDLYQGKNGALVAQDPKTGEILALVGSRNYFDVDNDGNFNVAIQGLRQPGSAIKPLVYATAFERGYTPSTVVFDLPTEFDTTGVPEKSYSPNNYDGTFRGPVTLRTALAQSINVPAVKTLYLSGMNNALNNARDFGLTTLTENNRYGLSLVLGGGEVRLIDLVGAYSVFAHNGIKTRQSMILEISTKNKILEKFTPEETRVMDEQYIRMVNDILSDPDARRGLFVSSFSLTTLPNHDVALKTGTTNDYRDAWTIGYTPGLVVGVWAGNNDNTPMQQQGGSILAALPMWHSFAVDAFTKVPSESFPKPLSTNTLKPMLKGEYVVTYQSENKLFPQIHDILFYVDKENPEGREPREKSTDSQFKNWEAPVMQWIYNSYPGDKNNINEPLPSNSVLVGTGETNFIENSDSSISITSPQSGSFISNQVSVQAAVTTQKNILKSELYFNNQLVYSVSGSLPQQNIFTYTFTPQNIELQNLLKITITLEGNTVLSDQVILFK